MPRRDRETVPDTVPDDRTWQWPEDPTVYLIERTDGWGFKIGSAVRLDMRMRSYASHGADVLLRGYVTVPRDRAPMLEPEYRRFIEEEKHFQQFLRAVERDFQFSTFRAHPNTWIIKEWFAVGPALDHALGLFANRGAFLCRERVAADAIPGETPLRNANPFGARPLSAINRLARVA